MYLEQVTPFDSKEVSGVPAWLIELYKLYGEKEKFDVVMDDFPKDKWDVYVRDIPHVNPSLIEVVPSDTVPYDGGQPCAFTVRIRPSFLQIVKSQPRAVHRQITIDGVKHDLRNEAGVIMATDPIDLIDLVKINIAHVMNPQEDCGPRRCFQGKLQKTFNLRGQELAPKGSPLREAWINALALPLPKQKRGRTSKLPAEPTLGYVGSESG